MTSYVKTVVAYKIAQFYKEHFVSQPEVSTTSGSKVMAHYVIFTDIFKVTWRKNVTSYVKTERHSRSGILWGTFCHRPEVSATSGSKVMANYLFCTKVVTLTLLISDFQKKKFCIVACLDDIFWKKNQDDRTIRATCRAFEDRQTNRQTNESRSESGYFAKCWKIAPLTLSVICQVHKSRWWRDENW